MKVDIIRDFYIIWNFELIFFYVNIIIYFFLSNKRFKNFICFKLDYFYIMVFIFGDSFLMGGYLGGKVYE